MTYCIYHIPGVKIGVTNNVYNRVEKQQGYRDSEYEIIEMSDDINYISQRERELQIKYGYPVDEELYSKLKCNQMKINVTEMTTTFPCPVNKLKGHLMDNMGMKWDTVFGPCTITEESIKWILENVSSSKYNNERCYVYNRAFARWFDNNNAYVTRTGGIMTDYRKQEQNGRICDDSCSEVSMFELIRDWADKRGLYDEGDPKTQALKLVEEVGETCKAILKEDLPETIDGIGDCVVVLTNLAELIGYPIEKCIDKAYNEIKNRTGKMSNGTFKKD
jgi:NTP pyrophosphatase (non-canonical NTP hydrolase)